MFLKSITENKIEIIKIIESLRKEMIQTGIKEGLNSQKTIMLSKQLDSYITQYQLIN